MTPHCQEGSHNGSQDMLSMGKRKNISELFLLLLLSGALSILRMISMGFRGTEPLESFKNFIRNDHECKILLLFIRLLLEYIVITIILQKTLVISTSIISNNCLSRRENLDLV